MARAWLKVEGAMLHHPKVTKLAGMFGVHPYLIAGFLLAWWDYCATFGVAGRAAVCPDSTLDQFALPVQKAATKLQLPTMVNALRKVRLMDRDGRPHDWEEYAGALLTRRAKETQRRKLSRALSAGHDAGAGATKASQSRAEIEKKKPVLSNCDRRTAAPARMTGADLQRAFAVPA